MAVMMAVALVGIKRQSQTRRRKERERAQITSKGEVHAGEAMPVNQTEVEQDAGFERDSRSKPEDLQVRREAEDSHGGNAGVEGIERAQGPAGAFNTANHAREILHNYAGLDRPPSPGD